MCICSKAVSLRAWSALVSLVVSRAFCKTQARASCVHACMPQLWLRALRARRGRGAMTAHTVQSHSTKPVVERQRVTVFGVAALSQMLF